MRWSIFNFFYILLLIDINGFFNRYCNNFEGKVHLFSLLHILKKLGTWRWAFNGRFFLFIIYWFSFTWYGFIYIYYISWMFNMTCRRWGCYVNTKAFFQKWCSKSARFVCFFMLFFSLLLQQLFFIRTWERVLGASCKSTLKLFELFLKLLILGTFLVYVCFRCTRDLRQTL